MKSILSGLATVICASAIAERPTDLNGALVHILTGYFGAAGATCLVEVEENGKLIGLVTDMDSCEGDENRLLDTERMTIPKQRMLRAPAVIADALRPHSPATEFYLVEYSAIESNLPRR